jgi:hypothetical protein
MSHNGDFFGGVGFIDPPPPQHSPGYLRQAVCCPLGSLIGGAVLYIVRILPTVCKRFCASTTVRLKSSMSPLVVLWVYVRNGHLRQRAHGAVVADLHATQPQSLPTRIFN